MTCLITSSTCKVTDCVVILKLDQKITVKVYPVCYTCMRLKLKNPNKIEHASNMAYLDRVSVRFENHAPFLFYKVFDVQRTEPLEVLNWIEIGFGSRVATL